MRRAPLALTALLLLLPPASCKKDDPEADGRKVTAESDYDATEPIVHDGFRFRLDPPGDGWKLMRKEDIRRMVPDAVAGASHRDGVFGGVIVERLPGITLPEAIELVSANLPNPVIETDEDIEIEGLPAKRTVFTATIEGAQFRYIRVVFLREGFLYQLLAWGIESKTPVSALDPFVEAFSLTKGTIEGEVDDRPPVEEADGVVWRIRGGRFESVVSGLQMPAADSWRYLVGQELTQTNPEAELALAMDSTSTYLAVISERYEGGDPSGLVASIRTNLGTTLGTGTEERTRTIAGKEVPFLRYQAQGSLEFLVGVLSGDGAVTQIMTWYPKPLESTAVPAFEKVVSSMTLATEEERQALRGELLKRDGVVWKVAAHSAFLGDRFDDFRHKVTWAQPRGLYDVRVGDEAKTQSPNAVLSLTAPLLATYANVEVVDGEGYRVSDYHDGIAGTFDGRRDESEVVDGVNVRRSFGTDEMNGVEFRYAVTSAAHEGNAVVMTAWGPASSATVPGAIDQVMKGLSFPHDLPETSSAGDRFTDHHYGVSVAEPAGWRRTDMTPAELPVGRMLQWKKGLAELALLSVAAQGMSDDEAWLASFAEQTMRDLLAVKVPLGKPESSKGTLDGHPSRRLVYPQAQLEIVVRNSVLYMVIMANVSDADADRFRRGIKWHR